MNGTGTIRVTGPFKGVNTTADPGLLGYTEAQDSLNCLTDKGTIRRRNGFGGGISFEGYTGKVLGVYEYNKVNASAADGLDHYQLIKVGGSLIKVQNWSILVGEIDSGLSDTELCCFQTVNNRVYYCDGTKFKVTDATTSPSPLSYNVQITRPPNLTGANITSGIEAAATIDGTYDWKFTYYSSTWGQESPATDPTPSLTLTKGYQAEFNMSGAGITASPWTGDQRVDKVRMYRRKVSAGESQWQFVQEDDITITDWSDYTKDNDLDSTTLAPDSYSTTLPTFRYMAFQGDVLFMAGAYSEPTRLYYSLPGRPFSVTGYLETGSGFDIDRITGVFAHQGVLVIFKERSIWLLSGNSEDTFYLRKVVSDIGCRSHFSVVPVEDVLYFLSEDGFSTFDGATAKPVSGSKPDPIRNEVVRRNTSRDAYCVGARDRLNGAIWWFWASENSTENDRFYVYEIDESKRVKSPCWLPWSLPRTPTWMSEIRDPTSLRRWIQVGYEDGIIDYYSDTYDDDGAAISWRWKTGEIDLGIPEYYKIWGEFTVAFSPAAGEQNVAVNYYLNDAATASGTISHDAQDGILRTALNHSSSSIKLEFAATTGSQLVEVQGWTMKATKAGRY